MKKLKFYLTVITLVFVMFSCKKEENDQQTQGGAQFSFDQSQLKSTKADTVANAAAVVVTVEDLTG
ncbi:MAG TPA: hypothetical protein VIH57_14575, partial [Bacteroidales bacterium]